MKTFLLDILLLLATVLSINLHEVFYYILATVTIIKYAVDVAKYLERKFSKNKPT